MLDDYDDDLWINPGEPGYDAPFSDPTVPSTNMRAAMGMPIGQSGLMGSAEGEMDFDSGVGSYTPISELGEPLNNSYSTSAPFRTSDGGGSMLGDALYRKIQTEGDGFGIDPTTGWVESPNQRAARLGPNGNGIPGYKPWVTPELAALGDLVDRYPRDPHIRARFADAVSKAHEADLRNRINKQLGGEFTKADQIQLQKYAQGKAWVKQQLDQGLITPEAADELLRQMATPAAALMAQKQITEKKKQQEQEKLQHSQIAKQEAINQENASYRAKTMEQRISVLTNPKTGEEEYWLDLGPGKAPHRVFEKAVKEAKTEGFDVVKQWKEAQVQAEVETDHTGDPKVDKQAVHKKAQEIFNKDREWFHAQNQTPGDQRPNIPTPPPVNNNMRERAREILRKRGDLD